MGSQEFLLWKLVGSSFVVLLVVSLCFAGNCPATHRRLAPLPTGWIEYRDPQSEGKPYYHNASTMVTQWERPTPTIPQIPTKIHKGKRIRGASWNPELEKLKKLKKRRNSSKYACIVCGDRDEDKGLDNFHQMRCANQVPLLCKCGGAIRRRPLDGN